MQPPELRQRDLPRAAARARGRAHDEVDAAAEGGDQVDDEVQAGDAVVGQAFQEEFLLELGAGFAFIARQKRLEVDGRDYYQGQMELFRGVPRILLGTLGPCGLQFPEDKMTEYMQLQLDGIKTELSGVQRRLGAVEIRLDGVETRLDGVEKTVHKIAVTVSRHEDYFVQIKEQFKKLDALDGIQKTMTALASDLASSRADGVVKNRRNLFDGCRVYM